MPRLESVEGTMADRICELDHSGEVPPAVGQLPESQKSFARHACAGCAYLLGKSHAEDELQRLRARVIELERQPRVRRK